MPLFSEVDFNKIELQVKLDIANNVEFYLKIHIKLNFKNIKFYTELKFVKIEFQNRNILLNSLKWKIFCYIVLKLRVFIHFALLELINGKLHQ